MPDIEQRIMTKPLPKILEQMEALIEEVRELALRAEIANKEAEAHAEKARVAGVEAAGIAQEVALKAVGKLAEDIKTEQEELAREIKALKEAHDLTLEMADMALEMAVRLNKACVAMLNQAVGGFNAEINPEHPKTGRQIFQELKAKTASSL